jgi:hypothetical protein
MSAKESAKESRPEPRPLNALERYTIEESIVLLRTSRATLYIDIAAGKIKTIKNGKRRFIPGSEIIRLCSVEA